MNQNRTWLFILGIMLLTTLVFSITPKPAQAGSFDPNILEWEDLLSKKTKVPPPSVTPRLETATPIYTRTSIFRSTPTKVITPEITEIPSRTIVIPETDRSMPATTITVIMIPEKSPATSQNLKNKYPHPCFSAPAAMFGVLALILVRRLPKHHEL